MRLRTRKEARNAGGRKMRSAVARESIFQDWKSNAGRPHIQTVLVLLRLSQVLRAARGPVARVAAIASSALYRIVALGVCGIDIPVSTNIGPRLAIHHGVGLVVHNRTIIGSGVTLRQSTTLGSKDGSLPPRIADDVSVGPNACLIGPLSIGAGAVIGAGSVVVKDVEAGSVVAGNPAKPLSGNGRSSVRTATT